MSSETSAAKAKKLQLLGVRKPIASKSVLGCIIVGDGLGVREDGTTYLQYNAGRPLTNLEIDEICK